MKTLYALFLFAASAACGHAQQSADYRIEMSNLPHHEIKISADFKGIPAGQALEVVMSRSSPGRYALHEFAKNLYALQAADAQGKPLAIEQKASNVWAVTGHSGEVYISYTLFANLADGTYSSADIGHAHLNIPATFVWARGFEKAPIKLQIALPEGQGWEVATQLPGEGSSFTAPNLAYFMDSPLEIAKMDVREWDRSGQKIKMALHHDGSPKDADNFFEMIKKVVAEEEAVFGELPAFDYGNYTFLLCYTAYSGWDGMEHRNSTVIANQNPVQTHSADNIGTVSHEFFHAWNVERIRPKSLEPFNFESHNLSGELWFAEGFTSYYTDLMLARAGLMSEKEYADQVAQYVGAVVNSPGHTYHSAVEMSRRAPFVDAASSIDPDNNANIYISYYTYGCALGLALDLTIRQKNNALSLDDYMRLLWKKHGKPEQPYTMADLRAALAELLSDKAFADAFFDKHIEGRQLPDFEKLLAQAGFMLRPAYPNDPSLGAAYLKDSYGGVYVAANTLAGSPLYKAGIDKGDLIVSINNEKTTALAAFRTLMKTLTPGQEYPIEYIQRGIKKTGTIRPEKNKALAIAVENKDSGLDKQKSSFREAWLGKKAK